MKSWIGAFCMLILGICIGFLIASRRPNKIPMAFDDVGELFINPGPKDVITWSNDGNPLAVKFKGPSPCKTGEPDNTCIVQATRGYYFYDCQGCPDPGIGLGSDAAAGLSTKAGILPPPYAEPRSSRVSCDAGIAKAEPITFVPGEGDSFLFLPNGNLTFSINFAANTCTQGDVLKNGSACTLKPGATSQPAYPITVVGCKDGTGSLTIKPPKP